MTVPRGATRLAARWRRFWHCLWAVHRMETAWVGGRTVYLGCECGRVLFQESPDEPPQAEKARAGGP